MQGVLMLLVSAVSLGQVSRSSSSSSVPIVGRGKTQR